MAIITGTSGDDNDALGGSSLIGTSANDTIDGNAGDDFIDGWDGNDFLHGEAGFDTIRGGRGNDHVFNGSGMGSLDGGAGMDWVHFEGLGTAWFNLAAGTAKLNTFGPIMTMRNFESIETGASNDTITGTSGKNSIYSGSGNDVVKAGGGNDLVYAGSGNDSIDGGSGNDEIHGDAGDDTIHGGAGYDTLYGGDGEDGLFGGAGNDVFMLGLGAASIIGGSGFDTLNYTQNHKEILADIPDGRVIQYNGSGTDYFESIEKVIGSKHHDSLLAGATTELDGFSGDDMIRSGSGANKLTGGDGVDTLSYMHSTGAVTVNLGSGSASRGYAQGDRIAGFENLFGSNYADVLTGSAGANTIRGEEGNDKINGGGGADVLYGHAGNDEIKGGSGADHIVGGAGADKLWGGSEADRFSFGSAQDSAPPAGQRDVIQDFQRIQGDKIDLGGVPGNLSFIGIAAFSAANQVRYQQSGGNTLVEINLTGNNGAEMALQLTGSINLQSSDFIL